MIIYVTSFNQTLYDASASELVKSFVDSETEGHLLCIHEDNVPRFSDNRVSYINITNHPYLIDWLEKFKHKIPVELGGEAKQCDCPPRAAKIPVYGRHKPLCVYSNWNFRASQWYRKIISVKLASENIAKFYNAMMWIDCDSIFTKAITEEYIDKVFGDADVVYHYGTFRKKRNIATESGIVGYRQEGFKVIERMWNKYQTGEVFKQPRWDDAWTLKEVLEEELCKRKDLVGPHQNSIDAVKFGPFADYITHFKGSHGRSGVVRRMQ